MPLALRGFNPPVQKPEGQLEALPGGQPLRLHLGCGRTRLPGWVNVDCVDLQSVDVVADLNDCRKTPLPFQDDSVETFFMSHVIEHIPDTLALMQELHRISKVGATLVARTPYGSSDDAWEDPTHVRPYFIQSWGYFSMPFHWRAEYSYRADWQPEQLDLIVAKDSYSMRNWRAALGQEPDRNQMLNMLFTERNFVTEMVATLRSVKPIRETKKELQVLPQISFILTGK